MFYMRYNDVMIMFEIGIINKKILDRFKNIINFVIFCIVSMWNRMMFMDFIVKDVNRKIGRNLIIIVIFSVNVMIGWF